MDWLVVRVCVGGEMKLCLQFNLERVKVPGWTVKVADGVAGVAGVADVADVAGVAGVAGVTGVGGVGGIVA
ncbi:hypothetical protein LY78DRAFT_338833 [Colletotrichum sublineola]|nr:hypothetical protein LY78DRAFT_338833 [Colletotrichum sublineola]